MKPVVADVRYSTKCLRIEPVVAGASIIRLTSYIRDLDFGSGVVYETGSGFEFSGYSAATNLAPGMVDLEGLAEIAGVGRDAIATGLYDGARAYLFSTSYLAPVEDEEQVVASILGRATLLDERYVIQEFALIDVLSQTTTKNYAPTCPKIFGGQEFAGCKVDLGPITVAGTITDVTDNANFRDNARGEAADYFAAGTIEFTTGNNVGLAPATVKTYAADGSIEIYEAYPYEVQVGDAYSMVPGCRKRLQDCRDKWDNVANFGGFTFVPVKSKYSEIGSN